MRKFNSSQPAIINTELRALDESFSIENDGLLEQWYYDNTQQYSPNRLITPLTLTAKLIAVDGDTHTAYTPTFQNVMWYVKEWNSTTGTYNDWTLVTANADGADVSYFTSGFALKVKKNVDPLHGVSIRCVAEYQDPRDSLLTYVVEETVLLLSNRDSRVVYPEVAILSPSIRSFNPLIDWEAVTEDGDPVLDENGEQKYIQKSEFEFKGKLINAPEKDNTTGDVAIYKADGWGTEQMIPTNENGAESVAPVMDIVYADGVDDGDQADGQYVEGLDANFRATGNGGVLGVHQGNAYVKAIRGNTVVWNQLLKNNSASETVNGVTFTNNGDGTFTCSGTANSLVNKSLTLSSDFPLLITNHSYLLRGCPEGGSRVTSFCLRNNEGNIYDAGEGRIFNASSTNTSQFNISFRAGTYSTLVFKPMLIDLTLIYGEGNEPTTVEQFEADYQKWFGHPLTYEPYNAGSLVPVKTTAVKTNGFNQWDEEWEVGIYSDVTGQKSSSTIGFIRNKNFIHVLPSTEYYAKFPSNNARILFYDKNKSLIQSDNTIANKVFTTPANCVYLTYYYQDTSYANNSCINLAHDNSRNGEYEAHWDKTTKLPLTEVTGIADGSTTSVLIFPDGMKRVGDVYDEIKYEGGELVAYKRVGSVDLGTLTTWQKLTDGGSSMNLTYFRTAMADRAVGSSMNIVCSKYQKAKGRARTSLTDKTIGQYNFTEDKIAIMDSTYDSYSASDFTTAMSGVMLYYELAEPIRYVLDRVQPITDFIWYGVDEAGEHLVETMPYYKEGQGTDTIKVDAMYGENIHIMLRCTKTTGSDVLSPSKSYANLVWRIDDLDVHTVSYNGGSVRGDKSDKTFGTIVNVKGGTLTENQKKQHLLFNWKHRKNTSPTESDAGWGLETTISGQSLVSVRAQEGGSLGNSLVYPYTYLLGAYEEVVVSGSDTSVITDNGEVVYDRPM